MVIKLVLKHIYLHIGQSDPGPIDNSLLIQNFDEKENREYCLKSDLKENIDYHVINKKKWNALSSWYRGGPPILRPIVELFDVSFFVFLSKISYFFVYFHCIFFLLSNFI